MQLYKTGGGPCESRSDTIMDRVREIIKPSVDGLTNAFDSDAVTGTITLYKNKTYENNTYEDNTYEDNTYEDNTYEDNTYEDNIYEDSYQIDVLNYLKEKYAVGTKRDCLQDLSNKHEDALYYRESKMDNNKNRNVDKIDANKNSLSFENNNDKHLEEEDNVQKSQKRNLPKISAIQVLKKKISIPLQEKRKSSCNQSNLENINKRCKLPKGKENNSSSRKSVSTSTISSRMSVFNILAESKTELVQFMKKDLQTKSEVEVQILNMQLKKEELEVQLLEKELLLKDHIEERIAKIISNAYNFLLYTELNFISFFNINT